MLSRSIQIINNKAKVVRIICLNTKHAFFKLSLDNFSKRSSNSLNLFSSASIVLKGMVFSDLKESIKTCDSDN
jgi:hypothetical protein